MTKSVTIPLSVFAEFGSLRELASRDGLDPSVYTHWLAKGKDGYVTIDSKGKLSVSRELGSPGAPKKTQRDKEIRKRYRAGESQVGLSKSYRISPQRISVICREH